MKSTKTQRELVREILHLLLNLFIIFFVIKAEYLFVHHQVVLHEKPYLMGAPHKTTMLAHYNVSPPL